MRSFFIARTSCIRFHGQKRPKKYRWRFSLWTFRTLLPSFRHCLSRRGDRYSCSSKRVRLWFSLSTKKEYRAFTTNDFKKKKTSRERCVCVSLSLSLSLLVVLLCNVRVYTKAKKIQKNNHVCLCSTREPMHIYIVINRFRAIASPPWGHRRQAQGSCPLWEEPPEGILNIF